MPKNEVPRLELRTALARNGFKTFQSWLNHYRDLMPCSPSTAEAILYSSKRAAEDRYGIVVCWMVKTLCEDTGLSRRRVEKALFGEFY